MNPSRFDQNHFALLGLSPDFQIDLNQLDTARQRVQAVVHPDRFASAGPAQKRLALQWSTRIHEAYETLREPLKRATYLLTLKGISVDAEQNTRMPLAFLEQQMEWREALEAARSAGEGARRVQLVQLKEACAQAHQSGLERLTALLAQTNDEALAEAAAQVRALMFIEKFSEELR
ncbi:MAG: co-chaperone HscB [Pseudomonadota bacterium]